jgi:O-antigen/teichoic acid export membrane protein
MSDGTSLHDRFRSGVRWSLAGAIATGVLSVAQTIVFARYGGPTAVSDFVLATTVVAFLTPLAEAGLGPAIVQAREVHPSTVVAIGWVNLVVGVFVCLVLYGIAPWIASGFERPVLATLIPGMAAVLLITPIGAQYGGLMVRHMRFDHAAIIEWWATLAGFLAVWYLAAQGWGAWAMGIGFILKSALASFGSWWYGRHLERLDWFRPGAVRDALPMLRFGFHDLAARWADAGSNYADKLLIGKWLGATSLGFYAQAFGLYIIPTGRLGLVVTRVAFPVFARLQDDRAALQAFFDRIQERLIRLLFPMYFGMMLFHVEITDVCFGPEWAPAAPLLVAFGVAGLGRTLGVCFPMLTRGLGLPLDYFRIMLAWTIGMNIVIALALVWFPHAAGAAWARVASVLIVEIPLLTWLALRCGISLTRSFHAAVRIGVWLACVCVVSAILSGWIVSYWAGLTLRVVLFGVITSWVWWGLWRDSDISTLQKK